jgi:hypothetical protein
VSAPSTGDLLALLARWANFEGVSSNPGDPEDDTFANGTEWGVRIAARQLAELLTLYGEDRRVKATLSPKPLTPVSRPRAMLYPPVAPEGWKIIPPTDAVPGDGVFHIDLGVSLLGPMMFDPIPVEIRRQLWAVRRVSE